MASKGRPPKAVVETNNIIGACNTLLGIVKEIPELCIAFDSNYAQVEISWRDDVYKVDLDEVPTALEAIRYLRSVELTYVI